MTDLDKLEPIAPTSPPKKTRRDVPFAVLTQCVKWGAWGVALLYLGLSGYFFWGFADNDRGWAHLFSAFIMCFGVGAALYGPSFFIAYMAHRAQRASQKPSLWFLSGVLIFPWLIGSLLMIRLGNHWILAGIAMAIITLIGLIWIGAMWRVSRIKTQSQSPD